MFGLKKKKPQITESKVEKILEEYIDAAHKELDAPANPVLNEYYEKDKSRFGFWGLDAAKLVKTPETLYIPGSFDAYKFTALGNEFKFKSDAYKKSIEETVSAATKIVNWTNDLNLNELFLKNSVYSAKHRWPFTCNINFEDINTDRDKIFKVITHMHNINSDAALVKAGAGMGWVARKKLDLDPLFYAFGSKFYQIGNKKTGATQTIEHSGKALFEEILKTTIEHDSNLELIKSYHIGMPITKEIRIFTIDGAVQAFIPYWIEAAFKGQSVYGMKPGKDFKTAFKEINTFDKSDLDYLRSQTEILAQYPKFRDSNWAIDWVTTRDGEWYMTDMQIAESSYLSYKDAIFATKDSEKEIYNLMNNCLQKMKAQKAAMSKLEHVMFAMMGCKMTIAGQLERSGYPTQRELLKMGKLLSGGNQKTK